MSIKNKDLESINYKFRKYNLFLKNLTYDNINNEINTIHLNKFYDNIDGSLNDINIIIDYINKFIKDNPLYIINTNDKDIIYYINLFLKSLKINNSLKYLYWDTYYLTNKNHLLLNNNLYKNIEYIRIYHTMYDVYEDRYLFSISEKNYTPLENIDFLAKNILKYPCIKILKFKTKYHKTDHTEYVQTNLFDVNSLSNSLEINKTLQTLKVNNTSYKHNIIYPHVDYILKGLIKNTSLKKLDFYYFNIEDINLLIQLLKSNNTIEKIKLWKCNIKLDENLYCKTNKIIIYNNEIKEKNKNISKNDFIVLLQDILKNKRLNIVSKTYFRNIFNIDIKINTKTVKGCIINRY